jgi:hypothetical protein
MGDVEEIAYFRSSEPFDFDFDFDDVKLNVAQCNRLLKGYNACRFPLISVIEQPVLLHVACVGRHRCGMPYRGRCWVPANQGT